MMTNLTNAQRQQIQDSVDNTLKRRSWFAGSGFKDPMYPDKLIIAYNFFPAFELVEFKTEMLKFGVEYELKDVRVLKPGSHSDEIPPYIR